jgi:citrate lyase subunit beta/citryl-CoA lyase
MLYMPGTLVRAHAKARSLPADGLIFDLEDGVLPEKKEEARQRVREALERGGYGRRELVVRVNPLDSDAFEADVEAVAGAPGLSAVLLPKVESPGALAAAEAALERAGAPEAVGLMAMIETPRGVLEAQAIATSTARLVALVIGTNDLEHLTHARQTPDRRPMQVALSLCVLAARAHGLAVVDGLHDRLGDPEGLERACQQGVELGFDGKTLIHPEQIDAANRAFGPSPEAVAEAREIVRAFEEARDAGKGVTVVKGKMVESLHARIAERRLALARGIALLEDEAEG